MSTDETPSATGSLTQRVGLEIKIAMLRANISGRQLAIKIGESQSWISTRLTGATPIDLNDLDRIARALGVPIGDLLPREAVRSTADLDARDTRPNARSAPHPVDVRSPAGVTRRRPKIRQQRVGDLIAAGATGPAR